MLAQYQENLTIGRLEGHRLTIIRFYFVSTNYILQERNQTLRNKILFEGTKLAFIFMSKNHSKKIRPIRSKQGFILFECDFNPFKLHLVPIKYSIPMRFICREPLLRI